MYCLRADCAPPMQGKGNAKSEQYSLNLASTKRSFCMSVALTKGRGSKKCLNLFRCDMCMPPKERRKAAIRWISEESSFFCFGLDKKRIFGIRDFNTRRPLPVITSPPSRLRRYFSRVFAPFLPRKITRRVRAPKAVI